MKRTSGVLSRMTMTLAGAVAVLATVSSPASAAPAGADWPSGTGTAVLGQSEAGVAAAKCGYRTSGGGAQVYLCSEVFGTGTPGVVDVRMTDGQVFGASFLQAKVRFAGETTPRIFQSRTRPYIPTTVWKGVTSVTFAACNSNGCGPFS